MDQLMLPGQTAPTRPLITDESFPTVIARGLLFKVLTWFQDGEGPVPSPKTVLDQLTSALRATPSDDSYRVARHLETCFSWYPDDNLINILSEAQDLRVEAHRTAVQTWAAQFGPRQTFLVGDRVRIDSKRVMGEVVNVSVEYARYDISCPDLGHRVDGEGFRSISVPFEDVSSSDN